MSDQRENRPESKETRTSLVDEGWSDVPPAVGGDSTVQLSEEELAKLVNAHAPAREQVRELPRYDVVHDDASADSDRIRPEDATKRIAYAALLGGSQAGQGGPRRSPEVHDQPTLVAHQPLSEEAARALSEGVVSDEEPLPSFGDSELQSSPQAESPLPSFGRDSAPSFDTFEQAALAFPAPMAGVSQPGDQSPPRPPLDSEPLPNLGFDDTDLTVRAEIKMPPEMFESAVAGDEAGAAEPPVPAAPTSSEPVLEVSPAVEAAALSAFAAAAAEPHEVTSPGLPAPPFQEPPAPVAAQAPSPPPAAAPLVEPGPSAEPTRPAAPALSAESAQPLARVPRVALGQAPVITPPGWVHDDVEGPPGFWAAMRQRCLLFGVQIPVGALWFVGTGLVLIATVFLVRSSATPSTRPPPASVAPSLASEAPASEAPSLQERAAAGDPSAVETLSKRPESERSVADAVALAKAQAVLEVRRVEQLRRELLKNPTLVETDATREKLLEFVMDPRTAPETLALISELPSAFGPDLLYEIWTGTKKSNDTTQLAKELVYKPSVKARATDALQVALDLREEQSCEAVVEVLPRAEKFGDWRSLHLLGRLLLTKGCGQQEREDCYPCLRTPAHEESIGEAIKAVRGRPRPKL